MKEATGWHYKQSDFFRRLLDQRGFDPVSLKSSEDLNKLPFIHVNFFKQRELLSIPRSEVGTHLTSSGTTGQKSQVFFDEGSLRRAMTMVDDIFDHYGWVSPEQKVNYLLFTYESHSENQLGTAYTDYQLCRFAPVNRLYAAIRRLSDPKEYRFDPFGAVNTLESYAEEGLPVRIFGFPSYLHFCLTYMKRLKRKPLSLHPDSLIFLGGGWKGFRDQEISKDVLYQQAMEWLGISGDRIRDGFGSVEHCIPYVECSGHRFHIPVWSRAFVRSVKDLSLVPHGVAGYLQFMSPYITSMPAINVLMNDLGVLHEAGSCSCGLKTPWFEYLGRAGVSAGKTCAATAADLLGETS